MTKCIGCKKEFNHQGFPSHKRSCKAYKREIRARLSNIPDYAPGPGPSTSDEAMAIVVAGEPEDVPADEVQVSSKEKKLNYYVVTMLRNQKKSRRLPWSTENLVFPIEKQGSQNDFRIYFLPAHL
jgi:hypothetical protein